MAPRSDVGPARPGRRAALTAPPSGHAGIRGARRRPRPSHTCRNPGVGCGRQFREGGSIMDDSGGFTTPPPPPPPPGGEGGAGGPGLPPRGIGEILSTAFEIYKANATNLLMIVAIVVVPLTFISAFLVGGRVRPRDQDRGGPGSADRGDDAVCRCGAPRRRDRRRDRRDHLRGAAGGHHAGSRAGQHRRPGRHRRLVQVGVRAVRQRALDLDPRRSRRAGRPPALHHPRASSWR